MESKRKILILYHSGAGSTKTIAEVYYKALYAHSTDIASINLDYDYKRLEGYDFIIFAFPTYHCSPSCSMMDFIKNMPVLKKAKKAFSLTTCGLYPGNALREFIKECSSKNLDISGYAVYKAPATDGALLLPSIPFMFNYEKNIAYKIREDIKKIEEIIESDVEQSKCPPFKLYTILNYPNRVLGKASKHKFKLLKEHCVQCNRCAHDCIRKCWSVTGEYPQYEIEKCEFCFRCVHHCPNEAIILSAGTRKKAKLNEEFYKNLQEKIIREVL